jgi:hypothetical protein
MAIFPAGIWDGTTSTTPNLLIEKVPDIQLGDRYRSEIIALEKLLVDYITLLDKIKAYGTGNSVLGVKADGTDLEYKVLIGAAGITITHGVGQITIGGMPVLAYSAEADVDIKAGQALHVKVNSHVELATNNTNPQVAGIAIVDANTTFACDYVSSGEVDLPDWTDATGAANLTTGSVYYLDVNGRITTTSPTSAGISVVKIGRAITNSTLDVEIEPPILL